MAGWGGATDGTEVAVCADWLLEQTGIAAGEDNTGTLGPSTPGRLPPDAGTAADHHDGLPGQVRFTSVRNPKWVRWSWFPRLRLFLL
jgi:hypothetical protein